MKRALLAFFVFCGVAYQCVAEMSSANAIITVINTRTAVTQRVYEQAVEIVANEAKAGKILQQYLIALLSREEDVPESARISDEVREQYIKNSRDAIYKMANKKNNSLAWYLISLENNDIKVLKHAADLGNVQALNAYGTIHLSEAMSIISSDPEAAKQMMKNSFDCFTRAANLGDANAMNSLGLCYQNGYGCDKSDSEAFKCFTKAAQKHHPEAVNNLGRFYREGVVVKKNLEQAFKCFELSSNLGSPWGTVNLATALLLGEGCKKNSDLAVAKLVAEARQKRAEAMDFLADCYDKGIGDIKRDAYLSLIWKLRARAQRGDKNAKEWLKANKAEL